MFTTPTEFFAPFQSDVPRLFDFKQTLRGRELSWDHWTHFSPIRQRSWAWSRAGAASAKSKLLHDWVHTVTNRTVLYLREDADWHPEVAKEIPAGDVLIVADDAHRFDFSID